MPKIFEYLGISILFYSNEHEPVHVHGKYQGYESKAEFIIVDGKIVDVIIKDVRGREPLPTTQLKEFKRFVNTFSNEIVQKWIDYFVLHKEVHCIKIEGSVR
ncbi:MAG: DUF4160 domain-containing protein [Sulfurimonas sp.]|uniref:DUF4160 domain-containing protein n=1 Tax=Sulfurimonas sp. TaxID=2022749 RepID=UPI0026397810|nr:DUF4160 domain-containing protein [Sulfurimonas sp.]MDD5373796.1 DUF4160 domain-containing protein [Sulfurimonas sp.]